MLLKQMVETFLGDLVMILLHWTFNQGAILQAMIKDLRKYYQTFLQEDHPSMLLQRMQRTYRLVLILLPLQEQHLLSPGFLLVHYLLLLPLPRSLLVNSLHTLFLLSLFLKCLLTCHCLPFLLIYHLRHLCNPLLHLLRIPRPLQM